MSSEDLQWLESYLRHGYDPEAQGVDDHAAFYQSNPYFAVPPSSSYTAAHNGSAGTHGYQYSNERDVRPPSFPENQHHPPNPRSHQTQYTQASTVAPPPGSHTESSSRFAAPFGPKSLPSKSPRPPPSQEYKRAHQLPKPVQTHRTGPPAGYKPPPPRMSQPAPQSNPAPPPGYQPASYPAPHSVPQAPSRPTPPQMSGSVSSSLPPAQSSSTVSTSQPQVQPSNAVISPLLLQMSNTAPPLLPPTPAQAPNSRPSPMPPTQFTTHPSYSPMTAPQTSSHATPTTPAQASHSAPPLTVPTSQPLTSAPPPNPPAQMTNTTSQATMQQTNTGGNGSEPGHDAKRRRIAPPSTSKRSSGRPSLPSYATVPAEDRPAGGLSIYNYSPQTGGTGSPAPKNHLKSRADIVKPLREEDAVDKVIYDPKTIARDVLIAAGRHPTEETLNHHLLRLRDVFVHVDTSSDLSTFRWDLVDAQEPRDSEPPKPQPRPRPRPAPSLPVPPSTTNTTLPPPPQARQPPPLPQSQPARQYPPSQPLQGQPVLGQHLGSSKAAPQPQNGPFASAAPPLPQTRPQLPSTPQPPSQSSVPTTTTRVTPMTGKRRPGRPPGSTNKARQPPQQPQQPPMSSSVPYPVFACNWTNCQAQLHNLDGLKKHVFKVHVSQTLNCAWKGCTFPDALPAAVLFKHVKKEHLEPIAWKLGDGPTVPVTVGNDASGSPGPLGIPDTAQPNSEDSLIIPASGSSIRAFNRVHGNNTQQERSREILKAVQRLKEHIGVGLDPGGCELATPARNERLNNDEDVYEVVPAT
ncbi:hypothetical protein BO79DRAFT_28882 [Aspergillus costaricaensis CBS 115574]|uniref:Uncharacterized protein n=1 Tax=Aspergillus costaricaensis CBS 115574 TaxID=1448317 RepID=A0ACD1ICY7_9EURO|nr:hypothetical protein BO79DRAFT_28882 [Aspergillus costaricaensis CBS 115574]RAK87599.1 hypothetical protein BO79DRAFT_28882 [Aspergillus costaricaensis CBS 115574]